MVRKQVLSVLLLLLAGSICSYSKDYKVTSPSGALEMCISVEDGVHWGLSVEGTKVMDGCGIGIQTLVQNGMAVKSYGEGAKVSKVRSRSVSEHIVAPFYRQAEFDAEYGLLTLAFRGGWGIEARAYDDGVAYRIFLDQEKVDVLGESASFRFTGKYSTLVPYTKPSDIPFQTSFENLYVRQETGTADPEGCFAFTPVYVDAGVGRLLIMESDVENYPGMFLRSTEDGFEGVFPPVPGDDSNRIAKAAYGKHLPWRIVGYAKDDKGLPVNNMVYALGSENRLDDISWIEPGFSAWDWWNANVLHGVPFKSGINTETYKYDIDFAARFGIPYIIIDDGWYYRGPDPATHDMTRSIPEMDIPEICRYGKEKGVKVILWCSKGALIGRLERIMDMYEEMGVSGFKVDFFDAQNQNIVNMAYRMLESAARHHMVMDLHGFYKPTGINRTWPNLLNVEGVFGLENAKWMRPVVDMPRNDATIPFIRQAAGFMDYTPGALRNAGKDGFAPIVSRPLVQGTRAHQVALYLVLDMPLAVLCDSPSDYIREEVTTRFITSLPTVFDQTAVLSGKAEEGIVMARRKGSDWYVGGITSFEGRTVDVDLSFLPEGQWDMEFFHDGPNSDVAGTDFVLETMTVPAGTVLPVEMSPGGGFAMILRPAATSQALLP